MTIQFEKVNVSRDMLGEGVTWDPVRQVVFWIDSHRCLVRCHDPRTDTLREWTAPSQIGSFVLGAGDDLVVALTDGFHRLDLGSGAFSPLVLVDHQGADVRFNDGKADRQGRFITGTMMHNYQVPTADGSFPGRLYRLNADLGVDLLDIGIRLANATCFSPAGDRLYFADTLDGTVRVYDYDVATGAVSNRRILVDTRSAGSMPDGATVDADGNLWVTLPQAGRIAQVDADGRILRVVETPCPIPTSVSFGGPDLDVLYLTSISDSGTGRLVSTHPDSGQLYRIHGLGVKGIAEARFPALAR